MACDDGLVQQGGQVEPGQGLLAELGDDRLLGRPLAELLLGPGPLGDGPGQLLRLLRQRLGGLPLPGGLLAEPLQLPAPLLLGQLALVLPPLALDAAAPACRFTCSVFWNSSTKTATFDRRTVGTIGLDRKSTAPSA